MLTPATIATSRRVRLSAPCTEFVSRPDYAARITFAWLDGPEPVAFGHDGSAVTPVVVWPTDVFMEEARRAQSTPMTVRGARDYARILFAGADEGSLDKQGRIGIAAPLREYAGLDRDVVVIGVMDRVEIWDPTRWRDYSAGAQAKFAELDEQPAHQN